MVDLAEIDRAMATYVRHQTSPVAIKMLGSGDEVPDGAKNPVKAFGAPFALCQAIGLCRRENVTIVLDKESQSCPIASAGLGFIRPDKYLTGKHGIPAENRMRAFRLIKDLTSAWHSTLTIHGEGSLATQRMSILALADVERYKAAARRVARIKSDKEHPLYEGLLDYPPKV